MNPPFPKPLPGLPAATLLLILLGRISAPAADPPITPVHFGQTLQASIHIPGESDYFTLDALPGDRFLAQLIPARSAQRFDLILTDPVNAEIARSASLGLGWDGGITAHIAGSHRIEVRDRSGQSGDYYLTVLRLNRPNPADEGRAILSAGSTVLSDIGPGDFDVYDFQAAAGDHLVVRTVRTTSGNPWFAIYRPDGSPLRTQPDATDFVSAWAFGDGGREALRLRERGTYRIIHGHGAPSPHRSRLTLIQHPWPNLPDPDGGELKPFTMATGSLDPGDTDAFFFVASDGDLITLRLTRTSGDFQPEMWILDPAGIGIANPRGSPQAQVESLPIRSSGLHLVLVYDDSSLNPLSPDSGDYSLHLSGQVRAPGPTQIYLRHLGDEHLLFWSNPGPDDQMETSSPAHPHLWSTLPISISSAGGLRWARVPNRPDYQLFRVHSP